ncbi:MAG: hypothetical protein ACPG7U_05045 [Holosporaceae bacterium]
MKACLSLVIMVLMATAPLLAEQKLKVKGKQYPVRSIQKLSNAVHRDLENLAKDIAADKENLSDSNVRSRLKKRHNTDDHTIEYIAKYPDSFKKATSKTKSSKRKKKAAKYAAVGTIAAGAAGLGVALAMDGGDGGGDTGDGTVGGEGFYPGDGGGATTLPGEVVDPDFSRPVGPQPR